MTKMMLAGGVALAFCAAWAAPAAGASYDPAYHVQIAGQSPATVRTYAGGKADMVRDNVYMVGQWGMKDANTICFAWPSSGEYSCWSYQRSLRGRHWESRQLEGGTAVADVYLMEY